MCISFIAGRVHSDGPSLGFEPEFTESMTNVTVATGRDAVLSCSVANLGGHKVKRLKEKPLSFFFLFIYFDIKAVEIRRLSKSITGIYISIVQPRTLIYRKGSGP